MLRSRTIREGSVGLLALVGIVLFGSAVLWLRGINFRARSYEIIGEFPNVNGIQVGDSVRYRGLKVGRILEIQPASNGVDVIMEIFSDDLLIPKEASLQASSSGLIGETFIDILPQTELADRASNMNPLSRDCDPETIICDSDRLQGQPGITLDDLLPLTFQMTTLYSDPRFFENVNAAVKNTALAAEEATELGQEMAQLLGSVERELKTFSSAAESITNLANNSSGQIAATAEKYQVTADQLNQLTANLNTLLEQNQDNLVATLDSIKNTSDRLYSLTVQLDQTLASTDTQKLAKDLETLTANVAEASANLKDISTAFNNPNNLVTLQQTLDSARATFANTQKITADLDEITGDPEFRNSVRDLVEGLSSLVSSTQELEKQIETTQFVKTNQQVPKQN